MMGKLLRVVPYTIDALKEILSECSQANSDTLDKKLHTRYFEEYFAHLGAQTMVVEGDYVDRDFCAAHNLWICHPDGRDPRAPHGMPFERA